MPEGILREEPRRKSTTHSLDTPEWITYIINNIAAYENFCTFLTNGIHECETQAADAYLENDERLISLLVGKREALRELLQIIRTHEQEERHAGTS